jgi:hypothetical protein
MLVIAVKRIAGGVIKAGFSAVKYAAFKTASINSRIVMTVINGNATLRRSIHCAAVGLPYPRQFIVWLSYGRQRTGLRWLKSQCWRLKTHRRKRKANHRCGYSLFVRYRKR